MPANQPIVPVEAEQRPAWAVDLKPLHWTFVQHYLATLNAVEACRRTPGLSPRRVHVTSAEFMRRQDVQAAINAALAQNFSLTKGTVLEELATIGFAKPLDYVRSLEGPKRRLKKGETVQNRDEQRQLLALAFVPRKLDALEKIAKVAGLQRQAAEAESGNTVVFIVEAPGQAPQTITGTAIDITEDSARHDGALVIEGA